MDTETSNVSSAGEKLSYAQVRDAAKGRWQQIFLSLAENELGVAVASAPEHVPCPVHGGTNGYRLFEHFHETGRGICNTCGPQKSGFETLAWVKNIGFWDAVDEVRRWLKLEDTSPPAPLPVVAAKPKMPPKLAFKLIADVWKGSTPIDGTPAERYLEKRGIWKENISKELRAHPGLPYIAKKGEPPIGVFPCLLAPVRNGKDGRLVTLHRIYVTPEGHKAPVPDPKKMMTPHLELKGSAVRLFPAEGEVLGFAEGIETALAAHAISRMPVWAGVFATLMEQVAVPEHVKRVVIWADRDTCQRGEQAANSLANRLEKSGIAVEVYMPPISIPENEKTIDWLDALLMYGPAAFPSKWRRWRPPSTSDDGTRAAIA